MPLILHTRDACIIAGAKVKIVSSECTHSELELEELDGPYNKTCWPNMRHKTTDQVTRRNSFIQRIDQSCLIQAKTARVHLLLRCKYH